MSRQLSAKKTGHHGGVSEKATPAVKASASPHPLVELHQNIGNRSLGQLIQSKLNIGEPDDIYERQADKASDAVMRMPDPEAANEPATSTAHTRIPGVKGDGQPLTESARDFFEPRFRHDFSHVRVRADAEAAKSARTLNSLAYTVGSDIVFGAGQYAPDTSAGRQLLAHELAHVAQQDFGRSVQPRTASSSQLFAPIFTDSRAASGGAGLSPVIRRKVSPDYATIEDRLTYGIFDWAITDKDARDVLEILNRLSDLDLADTVAAMDRDDFVDRLFDNIATGEQERYAVLIGKISRHRSASHSAKWIVSRLSYGTFDWMITDDDAHEALMALMGVEPQELRTVVANMVNEGVFDRLEKELPQEDISRYPAFLARLRSIRDEFSALVNAQVAYLRTPKPISGGRSDAGATIRNTVTNIGYGGAPPTFDKLPEADQKMWYEKANRVIAKVKASVRGTDLEPILVRGELVFEPVEAERLNAYAYVQDQKKLYFGRGWITDADLDPKNVWQSIAHELGGHEEFGMTWSWEIMRATLKKLTPEEQRVGLSSVNSVYSAYGYLETEIYAELRELPYRIPTSGGDLPQDDVPKELTRIRETFGPDVGGQIVIRLYYRVISDPRVSATSKTLLYDSIQSVFKLFPIVGPVAP